MAQTYTTQGTITKATVVRSYVDALQVNSDTLRSNFSGAAFPDNPVEGQHCYRTDKALEYIYKSGGWTVNDDGTPTNDEVKTARGSLASLNTRLDVSMNADGTLKNPATATIDEWKDNALVVTYVSATSFSVSEDVTPIFTASRKIKAVLGTTTAITSVASSSYDSTNAKTVVTVNNAVLTSELSAVKYSIVQYGVPSNCDDAALNTHNNSMMAHNGILHLAQRSTAYAAGDIAYMTTLPSWARLECVAAGTTAATAPNVSSITSAGVLITDGGVTWIVDDVRENGRVGDILLRPILRCGFVKANGATLKASDYPRLLAFAVDNSLTVTAAVYATDCSKYVYDSTADTLQVPNMTGRVLQGGDTVVSKDAGLPNITGEFYNVIAHKQAIDDGTRTVGAITETFVSTDGADDGGANKLLYHLSFDASKSNAIYGKSTTVQPPALQMIPQIKY